MQATLTHGHTDRYSTLAGNLFQIHRVKTGISGYGERYCPPEQITQTETNPCSEIHRLQTELQPLLQEQASLYPGGVVASSRPEPPPTPTPTPLPLSTHADPENGFSIKFPSQWDTRSDRDDMRFDGRETSQSKISLPTPETAEKDLLLVMAIPVSKSEYLAEKQAILLDPPGNWTSLRHNSIPQAATRTLTGTGRSTTLGPTLKYHASGKDSSESMKAQMQTTNPLQSTWKWSPVRNDSETSSPLVPRPAIFDKYKEGYKLRHSFIVGCVGNACQVISSELDPG